MGTTQKGRSLAGSILLLLSMLYVQQATAFEGDYIWEERFKAGLSKAQSGLAKDQYAVGDMYFRGRGTAKDSAKAMHWFLLAAKRGHKKAAYKAGYLYLYGDGVSPPVSPKKAFPWFRQAAVAGYIPAQYELGRLYFAGKVIKRNESSALKWLGRAKMAGYAPARTAFDQMVKRLVKAQKVSLAKSAH